jgi:hypothetical protein
MSTSLRSQELFSGRVIGLARRLPPSADEAQHAASIKRNVSVACNSSQIQVHNLRRDVSYSKCLYIYENEAVTFLNPPGIELAHTIVVPKLIANGICPRRLSLNGGSRLFARSEMPADMLNPGISSRAPVKCK